MKALAKRPPSMGAFGVILLGSLALLFASNSAVNSNQNQTEVVEKLDNRLLQILAADDVKKQQYVSEKMEDIPNLALTGREEDVDLGGQNDDGLVKTQGCKGHQKGNQWGSPDYNNCICQAPDRLCYRVDCIPGSEIVRRSDDRWNCEVASYKRDITRSAVALHERVKRFDPVTFGVVSGVIGIVAFLFDIIGFSVDRIESKQTTAQLNEIQDQIRKLDRKVDELTGSVSDLQLGQEYLRQVFLYGKDEQRLRNMLDTHAKMQISNGLYVLPGGDIQDWASSVLRYRSDGIQQVLHNLLDMVKPHSGVFGGKSLFEIYNQRLINEGQKYTEKISKKAAQVYGLIAGGYAVWIAALRIEGRTSEISTKAAEAKRELKTVLSSLPKHPGELRRVCERRTLSVQCPVGTRINILSAMYGRTSGQFCGNQIYTTNCRSTNSGARVRSSCQGRSSCTVAASNGVFGDPCHGTNKYLEVVFTCIEGEERRVCEHGKLPIKCPGGKRINIKSALYGRTSREFCGRQIYTTNCRSSNSGARVRSSCQGRSSCTVAASNGVFGDPCHGTNKYMEVVFTCEGAEKRRVCEHGALSVQCPAGKRINIKSALYGRTSREFCGRQIYTTNCRSSNSGARVKSSCQGRSSCSVAASNGVFGDPCHGTNKYLEVEFTCIV
ncbi:uncharacterized protein [Branchiostoma lanceolatum]|uniref:uncharacterized protein n=1 Tax=Branchiostoma lanceolatum TaxID=7740 RepID=UPI003456BAC7